MKRSHSQHRHDGHTVQRCDKRRPKCGPVYGFKALILIICFQLAAAPVLADPIRRVPSLGASNFGTKAAKRAQKIFEDFDESELGKAGEKGVEGRVTNKVGGNLLTRLGARLGIAMSWGALAAGGAAGALTVVSVQALSGANNANNWHMEDSFEYFWIHYFRKIRSNSQVREFEALLHDAANEANSAFSSYVVAKKKTDWCEGQLPCNFDFSHVYINQFAESRVSLIKLPNGNTQPVWEINPAVVFPYIRSQRTKKVHEIARELLGLGLTNLRAADQDIRRSMHSGFADVNELCYPAAITRMAAEVMGEARPSAIEEHKVCTQTAQNDPWFAAPQSAFENQKEQLQVWPWVDGGPKYMLSQSFIRYQMIALPKQPPRSAHWFQPASKTATCTATQLMSKGNRAADIQGVVANAQMRAGEALSQYALKHSGWCDAMGDDKDLCQSVYQAFFEDASVTITDSPDFVTSHRYDGDHYRFVFQIPANMFCGFDSRLSLEYVDDLAMELIRHSSMMLPALNQMADGVRARENVCPEASVFAAGATILGEDIKDVHDKRLCTNAPLTPIHQLQSFQAQAGPRFTPPPTDANKLPLFIDCTASHLQKLFATEIPGCHFVDTSDIRDVFISWAEGQVDQRISVHDDQPSITRWTRLRQLARDPTDLMRLFISYKAFDVVQQAVAKCWIKEGVKVAATATIDYTADMTAKQLVSAFLKNQKTKVLNWIKFKSLNTGKGLISGIPGIIISAGVIYAFDHAHVPNHPNWKLGDGNIDEREKDGIFTKLSEKIWNAAMGDPLASQEVLTQINNTIGAEAKQTVDTQGQIKSVIDPATFAKILKMIKQKPDLARSLAYYLANPNAAKASENFVF